MVRNVVLTCPLDVPVVDPVVVVLAWGTQPLTVPLAIDNKPLTIFGGTVEASDLLLILLVPLAAIAIHFWNTRTLTGLASLAPAEDREAAMVCGINVRRVAIISFAISGVIAGGAPQSAMPAVDLALPGQART